MSPTVDEKVIISALTLGFFKGFFEIFFKTFYIDIFFLDTGWYTPNMDFAEPLLYGYNETCSFLNGKCSQWSPKYFCRTSRRKGCNADYSARAECLIYQYRNPLPEQFRVTLIFF